MFYPLRFINANSVKDYSMKVFHRSHVRLEHHHPINGEEKPPFHNLNYKFSHFCIDSRDMTAQKMSKKNFCMQVFQWYVFCCFICRIVINAACFFVFVWFERVLCEGWKEGISWRKHLIFLTFTETKQRLYSEKKKQDIW